MIALLAFTASAQDSIIGGTQPETLLYRLADNGSCTTCHAGWAGGQVEELSGTMMGMAMHDPMFLAALVIAEQDVPDIGEFCLRCHTPPGWLEGRCLPGDGSALQGDDFEGITCDTCHRMMLAPDGPLIGNARYTIDDSSARRVAEASGLATHLVVADPYMSQSELCGVCHEVSNPRFGDFPIERTYSEWAASAYNGLPGDPETKQCQDCHMEVETDQASTTGAPRTTHRHRIVGANALVPTILATERPDLGISNQLLATAQAAKEFVQRAATVELTADPAVQGSDFTFRVRVTNETGHKLPTGYPEGRRLWLEVVVTDAAGTELLHSGALDPESSTLDATDPQLRVYEARLGTDGSYNYHMVHQNELILDTRIPPKGFRVTPDMAPLGREYPTLPDAALANWDDAPYVVALPPGTVAPLTVQATLLHQTTTAEFAAFLRDENVTNDLGAEWYRMWDEAGRDVPGLVHEATLAVDVAAPPAPITPDDPTTQPEGCGCASTGPAPLGGGALLVGALAAARSLRARRRRVTRG